MVHYTLVNKLLYSSIEICSNGTDKKRPCIKVATLTLKLGDERYTPSSDDAYVCEVSLKYLERTISYGQDKRKFTDVRTPLTGV